MADAPLLPPKVGEALIDLARDLILRPTPDAVRALARAYVDRDEGARLALEALDGGPTAARRAIELAALVLGHAVGERHPIESTSGPNAP